MQDRRLSGPRLQVQLIVGIVLTVSGVLMRFVFGDESFLPVGAGCTGIWLVLVTIREALASRSPDNLHRRTA